MGNKIHGDHLTKIYALWRNFRYRCNCPTSKDYKNYGARGINVYKKWNDYTTFKKWAISAGYKEGLTIERKDTNGNYTPKNCIFTSLAENNKNKRDTFWWHVHGIKFKSAPDAAKAFGVSPPTIIGWCRGITVKKKNYYPPKKNCFSIKKYKE